MSGAARLVPLAGTAGDLAITKDETTIGSGPENDCVIRDATTSRRHALLMRRREEYRVTDLESTNGTFVNGHRVAGTVRLRHNDEVRFGGTRYRFVVAASPAMALPVRKPARSRRLTQAGAVLGLIAILLIGFALGDYLINMNHVESADDGAGSIAPGLRQGGSATGTPLTAATSPTPVAPSPEFLAAARPWLDPLNHYRELAGLPPVTPDPVLTAGDAAHAHYLVENDAAAIRSNQIGAEAHEEDPSKPWYTAAGAAAARNSNVDSGYRPDGGVITPEAAIVGWLSVPFHRLWMLNPTDTAAGYGQYCNEGVCAAALDVNSGSANSAQAEPLAKPIMFPPANSSLAFTSTANEWPDPRTSCPGYTNPSGFAITLQLGRNVAANLGAYSLTYTDDSSTVTTCGFDATTYVNPDASQTARVRSGLRYFGAVVVLPRAPLKPGGYAASLTVNNVPYAWSFSIRPNS